MTTVKSEDGDLLRHRQVDSPSKSNGGTAANGTEKDTAHTNGTSSNQKQNSVSSSSVAASIAQTSAPEWLLILSLIFGGCCSNAYTLELATQQLPSSGTLITFAQFFVTTLSSLPHFITFKNRFSLPTLKERRVPLYRWLVQVVFYLSTSLLNNLAFGYDVPMPVHIVFRSGGLVINMILGRVVQGRKYSPLQIVSVLLVTVGVISSTLYSSSAATAAKSSANAVEDAQLEYDPKTYATGVLYLFSALVLTGFMGLWQEQTFKVYGNQNWRESLFYSHLLSLPMFAFRWNNLRNDLAQANATPGWWFGVGAPTLRLLPKQKKIPNLLIGLLKRKGVTQEKVFDLSTMLPASASSLRKAVAQPGRGFWIPSFYPPLILNVATQLLCINGVNRLTSKVSSLSVTLVLVVRKALSLMISVMVVSGGTGNLGLWLGASAVLLGTVGYSVSKPPPAKKTKTS